MRVQHNIPAMNAYRNFSSNTKAIAKNLEKLSSGYRINRAGDDAAGLAISEKMRAQITGLNVAQKNAKDGISLVQTAEGALTEVHSMLNRMFSLAEQSANGTYDNEVDRANLQKEFSALRTEIDRIADASNFNGQKLLDGSLSGVSGGKVVGGQVLEYTNASDTVNGEDLSAALPTDFDTSIKDKVTVDGIEINVDWSEMTADELSKISIDHTGGATADAAAVLEKYINASIDQYNKDNGASVKNITVNEDANGYVFTSGSTSSDGKVVFTAEAAGSGSIMGELFDEGTTGTITSNPAFAANATAPTAGDTFNMELNGVTLQIKTTNSAGSAAGGLAGNLQTDIRAAITEYVSSTGTTDFAATDITVSMSKDGKLEVKGKEGQRIGFKDAEGSQVAQKMGLTANTISSGAGGLTLQIGDTAEDFNKLTVSVNDMHANALGIAALNVGSQEGAAAAMGSIKDAINSVSSTRGDLGALQNRLEHTINNLGVMEENIQDAEATIRDTDVAQEMMAYTKNNILVQSAQAMLAQANQLPQGVLQLLG